MFERFILGTDLSPATFAVARCVGSLQRLGAKNCLLIHCVSPKLGAALALSYKAPEAYSADLESQQQILIELGFTVESRTEFGSPKTRITKIAIEENFSLIVIGTQGRTLLSEFVLGGTAYGVVSRSRTPVLLLPVKSIPGDDQQCESVGWCEFTRHVLFATDFSDTSDYAFGYVEEMARTTACQVTLVHVQEKLFFEDLTESKRESYNRLDGERLEHLKVRLEQSGASKVLVELPIGVPKVAIANTSESAEVSLVVMGTQGRGFLGDLTVGSVAGNTARRTSRPLLLVPPA